MEKLNRSTHSSTAVPVRILQFGEGNFLRAFVDWLVQEMNAHHEYDSGVAVIQPIPNGMVSVLAEQGGLYHHVVQGLEDGVTKDEVILNECIQQAIDPFADSRSYYELAASSEVKLVFSNTTEAGIKFDASDIPEGGLARTFPGKLTQWLSERFQTLGDSEESEIGIVPCELIAANGDKLKTCLEDYARLWELGADYERWIQSRVHFANTLVDRIVPGYPRDEMKSISERIGIEDQLVVKSESFHLFVIEGDEFIQHHFPADRHGFNVKYVDSIVPYRTQKVRILNGAHTSMVPVGLQSGVETVMEAVQDEQVGQFVRTCIFDEIVPTISLPGEDPQVFAEQVLARFLNPFIRHELKAISLNSISKWKVRVLPTVLDSHQQTGNWPKGLVFSLAALITFYLSGFDLRDDEAVLAFFQDLSDRNLSAQDIADEVLSNPNLWDQDLTLNEGLAEQVAGNLDEILRSSVRNALAKL